MTSVTLWTLLPMLAALFGAQPGSFGQSVTRLVVQDEVILRVPVQPHPIVPQFDWVEKKGPKCIPASLIRRGMLSGPEQVDFILAGGSRVRAHFDESCPALDFYGGFYLQYGRDQQICGGRDVVMSRIGGSCTIDRFKLLLPKFRR